MAYGAARTATGFAPGAAVTLPITASIGGWAGKSITSRAPSRDTANGPLMVWKVMLSPVCSSRQSRTQAVASAAWPQRSTSISGVRTGKFGTQAQPDAAFGQRFLDTADSAPADGASCGDERVPDLRPNSERMSMRARQAAGLYAS